MQKIDGCQAWRDNIFLVCYGINRESKIANPHGFGITEQLPEDTMHETNSSHYPGFST